MRSIDLISSFTGHDIGAVSARKADTIVDRGQLDLALKCEAVQRHLMAQAILINLLQESRPNRLMNLDGQANHPTGQVARGLLLRVLREHRVLRDSWINPARANGAIFPGNMDQTLNARCNSYYGLPFGPVSAVIGNASK
jgi:hypothetical protein